MIGESDKGNAFYVDFDNIKRQGGYVYYWTLIDHQEPDEDGDLSVVLYRQGDCKSFKFKVLSDSIHKKPMGEGTGKKNNTPDEDWLPPPPNSADEEILRIVCKRN